MEKETIELVKKMIEDGNLSQKIAEKYCPELKESEDERIRKEMLQIAKESEDSFYMVMTPSKRERLIAWLEKQGEQKPTPIFRIGDTIMAKDGTYIEKEPFHIDRIEDDCYWDGENTILVCNQDEFEIFKQKPTDDVEPKFEIGDLITNGILVGKIDEIHELGYHAYFGDHYADVPDVENWHKWTIQDAKDGDVLSWDDSKCIALFKNIYDEESFNSYGLVGHCTGTFELRQSYHDIEGAHPATKEQRDLLFQKMKEAGYEWDAEKKELKKVEDEPTWSYEDRIHLGNCIALIQRLSDSEANWLKSLKDRVQLKQEWSEEDEKTIVKMRDFFIRVLGDKPDFTEDKRYEEFIEFIDNRLKSLRP